MSPVPTLRSALLLSAAALVSLPSAGLAQDDDADNADADVQAQDVSKGEIIVRAERLRGQLDVEQAPLLELSEEDIKATGATSIAELIQTISPQTTSSRGRGGGGRPVFLVNGVRIGSFRELRSYPPEAIVKVEVMPEEVAQKFGFPPDRRVVNLILKENYSSRELEAEFEQPSQGGYRRVEGEFTLLRINNSGRTNFNIEVVDRTILTEDERDIIQTPGSVSDVAGDPDQALYRSLINDRLAFEASGNWAKTYLESGSSASLNTTYEREEQRGFSGLNTVVLTAPDGTSALRTLDAANPLAVRTVTDTISSAGSWTRPLGAFRLNTTFDASVRDNIRKIDRRGDTSALEAAAAAGTLAIDGALPGLADAGFDTALTETISAEAKSTLRGVLIDLPAGEFSVTMDAGYSWDRITSSDTRSNSDAQLTRGDLEGGLNVVIPLTSRRNYFADALGSFTLNGQVGFNHYSDFGTLYDWSAGLNWSPFGNLNLQATYVFNESVPGLASLGNPQTTTLNVPVFDFVNGETVLATVIAGGNPDLLAETQRDWKFSANWELPFWDNTRLSAEYINNSSDNVTRGFPALTAEIEAAFPDRFTRDAGGTLLSIDRRPVTFAETNNKSLVFGFTTRGSWGGARPQAGSRGGPPRGGPPGNARPEGTRPEGSRGPPSPERRAQFMAFRERLCADDGLEMLNKLVAAVESGEDVSAIIPNFDAERFGRMLARVRGDDGKVDPQRLARFRERICSMDPAAMRGAGSAAPQAGGRPQGGPQSRRGSGGGSGAFGRDGRGRYFLNISHSYQLENEILIAPGGPFLDQLDGDSTSNTGVSRHFTQLQAGAFRGGYGVRLSGFYTGKARVNGNPATGTSPLFFGELLRFNLRVFTNLGQVLKKDKGPLKGLTMSLRADNIFDARRRVVDENGDTPINFQPDLLDPTGRYIGIQFRKLF
jgi:hypothetical protein